MTDPNAPPTDPAATPSDPNAETKVETPVVAEDTVSPNPVVADAAPGTEPAQAEAPAAPELKICQHGLSRDEAETTVMVPKGTHVLDIHIIDGTPHVRTIEKTTAEPDRELTVRCIPLGGAVSGHLRPITCRSGGAHFFVVGDGARVDAPSE